MQRIKEIFETEFLTIMVGVVLTVVGWMTRLLLKRLNAWNKLRQAVPIRRAKAAADLVAIDEKLYLLELEQKQTRDLVWLLANRHRKGDEVCVFIYSSFAGNLRVNESYNALLGVFAVEHSFEYLIAKRRERDRSYLAAFDDFLKSNDRSFNFPDVTLIPVDGRAPVHVDVEASAIRNERSGEVIVVGVFRRRTEPPIAEDKEDDSVGETPASEEDSLGPRLHVG